MQSILILKDQFRDLKLLLTFRFEQNYQAIKEYHNLNLKFNYRSLVYLFHQNYNNLKKSFQISNQDCKIASNLHKTSKALTSRQILISCYKEHMLSRNQLLTSSLYQITSPISMEKMHASWIGTYLLVDYAVTTHE